MLLKLRVPGQLIVILPFLSFLVVGCGSTSSSPSTPTAPITPSLSATVSGQANFVAGASNAAYTITVTDAVGALATTGTVTVTDPPTNFTVTAISGTGWTCILATITCTRSDALSPGQSYPPITVTGTITGTAGQAVSIPIGISGGGLTTNMSSPGSITIAATYTVGGTVSGLTGSGLVLQDNGGNNLTVSANGSFTFTTALASSAAYSVTVFTQPTSPSQTCVITSASGSLSSSNVTNVSVGCTTNTYTVGGTVSGLTGSGLVLQDNGGNNLAVSANGSFTFSTALTSGTTYSVTVLSQPTSPNQTCSVTGGSGTVTIAPISTVAVTCLVNNPVPSISSLSPNGTNAGAAAFTLTVAGSNFVSTSVVQWNGSSRTTTYVSATQLAVAITAADVAAARNVTANVVNPAPGGGASSAVSLIVYAAIPPTASFVAPNGNDSNPGTITQPFLTIQHCAATVASGGTCAVRAGTYRETVTPNSGIRITAYNGESVTVDGSDPVTGWTLYQGSIYKANANLSTSGTNQVFVGSQMMTEARWPNGDDLFNVNWATAQAGTTTTKIVDSTLPNINWTGANIHLWSGSDPWSNLTGIVTASGSGQVTIAVDTTAACPSLCPTAGGYYYLFGILGALDAQREWYYDSSAGVLYFWAPGGANPSTLDVRAKQRQYAFDLSGKSNVTLQNLAILASTINTDASSTNNVLDGINAQYLSHFTTLPANPDPLTVNMATSGIIMNGTGNSLVNSTIAFSAGNGVVVIGTNNIVKNNLIHHVDYIGNYTSGVALLGTAGSPQNSTIQLNTIHTIGRQAIWITNWAGSVQNADISYNNLFSAMMFSRDGGVIYACCSVAFTGTHIHNNWTHDTQSLIPGAASNFPTSGVYIDNGAAGFEVNQNVIWNNQYENILVHGNGVTTPNDNNVHNNSIPDIASTGYISLAQIPNCGTTQVVNNLVLVPVNNIGNDPACTVTSNSSTAPGATEMNASVQVGCNFAGCSSSGPPALSGSSIAASIAVQPLGATVSAGQTATFTVTGAGSPTLTYQWQKNGVNINGATTATYTTPGTTSGDNGTVFTVLVSNSVGQAASNPATLIVN